MLKKIKYTVVSVITILTIMSCDNIDFGDTNANKFAATEPNTSSLLAGAIQRYSSFSGRNYLNNPTLYVQYQSQVTYTDEMRYNEAAIDWSAYYVQTLSNLQTVIDVCEDPANHSTVLLSQGAPDNQIAVSKIMQAVIFKRVTDSYGDIPFSEALNTEILTPKYDAQEDIYKGLIDMVKNARDMIDESGIAPTGDVIYWGDLGKWKKFANSLILQMSLQLSKKFPGASGYAATEFKSALNNAGGVLEDVDDDAWYTYNQDFNNPWFGNRRPDYFLSKEITDALKGQGTTSNTVLDARINVYSTIPSADGVPYGYENGSGAGAAQMSDYFWSQDGALPLLTSAYTYLNRADAANLGWTSENASNMLTMGIENSYATLDAQYGTTIGSAAAAYAAARVSDMTTVGAAKVIAEEKWIALFPCGFDAWAEWRRTNYPTLAPATDYLNNGQIPRRYVYPTSEQTLNQAAYQSGISTLSPASDNNTSKVWWDQ